MNLGQDRQMQMVGGNVQNPGVQNVGNQNGLIVVMGIANLNANQNGNGNVVAAWAEGTAQSDQGEGMLLSFRLMLIAQKEEVGIQLQAKEFDLMAAAMDLDEIKVVNVNYILMATLQQASTSDEQYTDLLDPIPEPHQVQQNDSNVIFKVSIMEQSGGTVEQHPATVEETHAYFESLYSSLAIEVEKVNTVNCKLRETNADLTTELTRYKNQEKCFEISQEKYDKLERWKLQMLSKEKSTVSPLLEEKKKLKSDFKIRKDELLDKQIELEKKIKELNNILVKMDSSNLETELDCTKERFENCIIKKENEYAKLWNDWEEKPVSNKPTKESGRTKLITASQPHVNTKKDVNSYSNGFSSTGVNITAKTRRPHPRNMDLIIPFGQKNTLAEYMILFGADNHPPMLDKDLYDSWKSIMELYMQNREHGRMILESVEHGPLIWPTIEENGVTKTKKYAELSAIEKTQADCDMKATNIILQGLPADIYSLVNHHRVAKDLWERVQLLKQGTSLTKQERECKLYDAFDKFAHIKGESLHNLPHEWSKFVTNVKLVKDLHTTKYDQLHAYLEQHELHANEVRLMREGNQHLH
ncbi:hypothetical protein Tco_1207598 [Tanacetum coccineum]